MPEAISLSQLESHLWETANILRGLVDAADFKSDVFPLLFFKRLSDPMLLDVIHHVEETRADVRTLWGKLYSQDKTVRQRRFGLAQRARRVRQRGKPPKQKNLTTSAIARTNLFLHGAADFQIVQGDPLSSPAHFSGDNLVTFVCVIATAKRDSASLNAKPNRRACRRQDHPPFSLEKWGDEVWSSDPYGRNFAGMNSALN